MRGVIRVLPGIIASLCLAAPFADAQTVTVRVVIERVEGLNCMEITPSSLPCPSNPDFYSKITIDGETMTTGIVRNARDISPDWRFEKQIGLSRGTVPVSIELWDRDGDPFDGAPPDDHVDLDGDPNSRTLELNVQLRPCIITGDVSDVCARSLESTGGDEDRARIHFRIEVEDPVTSPGLRITCLHDPVWPQAGQTAMIRADAVDATAAMAPRPNSTIELWIDDRITPAFTCPSAAHCETPWPATGAATFAYGCLARNGDESAWSGWRVVTVGAPASGRAVPIVYNGSTDGHIDVVFIAERDDFVNAAEPRFLEMVRQVIRDGYYAREAYLVFQDKLNFWIAQDRGHAVAFGAGCGHVLPDGWNTEYAFADAGAIVHETDLQDCAKPSLRISSGDIIPPRGVDVFLHEAGHVPFGLADEHLAPGGYFQADPLPNVYESFEGCRDDAPNLGREANACWSLNDGTHTWWISDNQIDHLMNDDGRTDGSDLRRIAWIFGKCRSGRC